jgi:hypothetical protein
MPSVENTTWFAVTIVGIGFIGLIVSIHGVQQTRSIYHRVEAADPSARRAPRVLVALESYVEMWLFFCGFASLMTSAVIRALWDDQTQWSPAIATIFQFAAWMLIIAACAIKQLWWVIDEKVLAGFSLSDASPQPEQTIVVETVKVAEMIGD